MEMVAGSFGSEVRCGALCPALPAPFHLPLQAAIAAASPAWTLHPSCPPQDPLPTGLAQTPHPSPMLAMSSTEHCWGQTRYRSVPCISQGRVCFWLPHIPGIAARAPCLQSVSTFRLVSGSPLSPRRAGQAPCRDPHARGSCRGAWGLPAWKRAPCVHRIRVVGMGLSQQDQWLQWIRQNIPINGKKPDPVWKEEGRGRLVFLGPF